MITSALIQQINRNTLMIRKMQEYRKNASIQHQRNPKIANLCRKEGYYTKNGVEIPQGALTNEKPRNLLHTHADRDRHP